MVFKTEIKYDLQIAHWAILLNLLWVLWQKSGADLKLEEDKIGEEVKATKDLKKVEKKDEIETASTALMG